MDYINENWHACVFCIGEYSPAIKFHILWQLFKPETKNIQSKNFAALKSDGSAVSLRTKLKLGSHLKYAMQSVHLQLNEVFGYFKANRK